ncbi:MAG: LamG domain-containing protein [Acidobacteria bacterium]|nr:LamG domain-containing protein [Acidobacteriota bacterium]
MNHTVTRRRLLLVSALSLLVFYVIAPAPATAQVAPWLVLGGPQAGYVEIPHDPELNPAEVFTIESWLHPVSHTTWAGGTCPSLVGKGFSDTYWLGLCSGKLRLYTHGSGSSRDSSSVVPLNEWTHIAAVYDGANINFYFNGVLDSTFGGTVGPLPATDSVLRIGNDIDWNFVPIAAMDDVRLWNVARTEAEIAGAMNSTIDEVTEGLVSSWSFSGSDAGDPVGGHDGVLVGNVTVGSEIPEPNPCTREYFVAAGAHAPGALGSVWRTDLHFYNRSNFDNAVDIFLLPRDTDNSEPDMATIDLEAFETMTVEDVVLSEFGEGSLAAAFRFCSPFPLQVASRTYNKGEKGSFGQGIPGLDSGKGIRDGSSGHIIGVSENELFRTNLGWVNMTSSPATLELKFIDGASADLGELSVDIPPYGHGQLNQVFTEVTNEDVNNGRIQVRPVGSRVIFYASVVDNPTGDGTFMLAE